MLFGFKSMRIFLKIIVNILHFFDDIIVEFDILARILEYSFAALPEFELSLDLLQDIANHELNPLGNNVKVVIFVKFIERIKDVMDSFYILSWITYLIFNNLSLIEK